VATRSACPWASASAAPTSERVGRSVTLSPWRANWPSADATQIGRYSGEVAGPLTAMVRAWRRTMSPSTRSPTLSAWRRIPGPPRDAVKARLLRLHVALLRRFGAQRWWPGRSAYEIAVGAILTRNTAWTSAARAIAALRERHLLDPRRLMALSEVELAAIIRSSGTSRLKTRRLRDFTAWLLERFGGRFHGLRRAPLSPLRAEMLAIPGLGRETVDAILLHAAGRPVAVADAYTRRVLARHRFIRAGADYETTRVFLEAHLPSDPALLNEFHGLLQMGGSGRPPSPPRSGPGMNPGPPRVPARRPRSPQRGRERRRGRARH